MMNYWNLYGFPLDSPYSSELLVFPTKSSVRAKEQKQATTPYMNCYVAYNQATCIVGLYYTIKKEAKKCVFLVFCYFPPKEDS